MLTLTLSYFWECWCNNIDTFLFLFTLQSFLLLLSKLLLSCDFVYTFHFILYRPYFLSVVLRYLWFNVSLTLLIRFLTLLSIVFNCTSPLFSFWKDKSISSFMGNRYYYLYYYNYYNGYFCNIRLLLSCALLVTIMLRWFRSYTLAEDYSNCFVEITFATLLVTWFKLCNDN